MKKFLFIVLSMVVAGPGSVFAQSADTQSGDKTAKVLTTSGDTVEVSVAELRSAFLRTYKKGSGLIEAGTTRALVQNTFELSKITFRIDEAGTKRLITVRGHNLEDALCLALGYERGTGLDSYKNNANIELADVYATADSGWSGERPWSVELVQMTEKANREILNKLYCRL